MKLLGKKETINISLKGCSNEELVSALYNGCN